MARPDRRVDVGNKNELLRARRSFFSGLWRDCGEKVSLERCRQFTVPKKKFVVGAVRWNSKVDPLQLLIDHPPRRSRPVFSLPCLPANSLQSLRLAVVRQKIVPTRLFSSCTDTRFDIDLSISPSKRQQISTFPKLFHSSAAGSSRTRIRAFTQRTRKTRLTAGANIHFYTILLHSLHVERVAFVQTYIIH